MRKWECGSIEMTNDELWISLRSVNYYGTVYKIKDKSYPIDYH